tara:strand:- start:483 stop:740 length:258 start_codon:yes stop_codon:yes gene_type:complete
LGKVVSTIRKTITFTDQQDEWIKNQIQSGRFTNDSEYIRVLLRQDQELNNYNDGIRKALIEGEKSGEAKLLNANEFKAKMAAKYV